jgi:hypothetical protein
VSTTATDIRVPITGGDPHGELLAQLSDIGRIPNTDDRPRFQVEVCEPGKTRKTGFTTWLGLIVNGLTSTDDSGQHWDISGEFDSRSVGMAGLWLRIIFRPEGNLRFRGHFNTRTRKGWLMNE